MSTINGGGLNGNGISPKLGSLHEVKTFSVNTSIGGVLFSLTGINVVKSFCWGSSWPTDPSRKVIIDVVDRNTGDIVCSLSEYRSAENGFYFFIGGVLISLNGSNTLSVPRSDNIIFQDVDFVSRGNYGGVQITVDSWEV